MSRNTRRVIRGIDAAIWEGTEAGDGRPRLRGVCGMIGTMIDVAAGEGEMAMIGVADAEAVISIMIDRGVLRRLMRYR